MIIIEWKSERNCDEGRRKSLTKSRCDLGEKNVGNISTMVERRFPPWRYLLSGLIRFETALPLLILFASLEVNILYQGHTRDIVAAFRQSPCSLSNSLLLPLLPVVLFLLLLSPSKVEIRSQENVMTRKNADQEVIFLFGDSHNLLFLSFNKEILMKWGISRKKSLETVFSTCAKNYSII